MARLVLTDASPLIALSRVDGLDWLRSLFGAVAMPPEVRAEVLRGRALPGEAAIEEAIASGWLRMTTHGPRAPELPDLDEGEAACIRIALASQSPALLLIDERAGRALAREHGLRVAGTAALIGIARQRGLVPSAREIFAKLHAAQFRLAPEVIRSVLRRVGE